VHSDAVVGFGDGGEESHDLKLLPLEAANAAPWRCLCRRFQQKRMVSGVVIRVFRSLTVSFRFLIGNKEGTASEGRPPQEKSTGLKTRHYTEWGRAWHELNYGR